MSRSSFLAVNSHGRRLHLVEVLLLMIASRHAHLRLADIEEDPPRLTMDPLAVEDIALRNPQEEAHHKGGMEAVQSREIAIQTHTGRAHSLVPDHREHAHGPILPDRGPGLPHVEAETTDVETAHRHRGEAGEEGVLATPAFPAIAIGAVAGVEVDMDAGGDSVPAWDPLFRSSMVDIGTLPCIRDVILGA